MYNRKILLSNISKRHKNNLSCLSESQIIGIVLNSYWLDMLPFHLETIVKAWYHTSLISKLFYSGCTYKLKKQCGIGKSRKEYKSFTLQNQNPQSSTVGYLQPSLTRVSSTISARNQQVTNQEKQNPIFPTVIDKNLKLHKHTLSRIMTRDKTKKRSTCGFKSLWMRCFSWSTCRPAAVQENPNQTCQNSHLQKRKKTAKPSN